MDFVYPNTPCEQIYENNASSFCGEDIVRININGVKNTLLDSFLMATYSRFQNLETNDGREKLKDMFINQFKGFLMTPSFKTSKELYDKVVKVFRSSPLSKDYKIKKEKKQDVFDIIIVEKNNTKDEKKRGFSLFPEKLKKYLSNVSNFFDIISENFLREIIDQKISEKKISHELRNLKKQEKTCEVKKKIKNYEEILDFMKKEENNLDPMNLLHIMENKNLCNQDIIMKMLSEFLGINIFLCRSWNSELTVIKTFHKNPELPYILIFKIDGRVSLTGVNHDTVYETGGIITESGIETIFEDGREVLANLKNIYFNNVESYYMEKYNTYLKNIEHQCIMCDIKVHYSKLDDKIEEEEEEEEELELLHETVNLNEKEQDEKIKVVETITSENVGKTENKEIDIEEKIPYFIKDYSTFEMLDVIIRETGKDLDYSNYSKSKIDTLYKNYLTENITITPDSIIERIKSRIV